PLTNSRSKAKKHGSPRLNSRSLNLGLPLRSRQTISPSSTALSFGNDSSIFCWSCWNEANMFPLREISCVRPWSIRARQRKPSSFNSKNQSGWSNGKRFFWSGIGWNGNMRKDPQILHYSSSFFIHGSPQALYYVHPSALKMGA